MIGIGEPLDEECLAAGFAEYGLEDRGMPAVLRLPQERYDILITERLGFSISSMSPSV